MILTLHVDVFTLADH